MRLNKQIKLLLITLVQTRSKISQCFIIKPKYFNNDFSDNSSYMMSVIHNANENMISNLRYFSYITSKYLHKYNFIYLN
jgi:hypothetical protein